MAKLVLIGLVAGVVAAIACVAVRHLRGAESNTAVVGGVGGGVAGAVVAAVAGRKKTKA